MATKSFVKPKSDQQRKLCTDGAGFNQEEKYRNLNLNQARGSVLSDCRSKMAFNGGRNEQSASFKASVNENSRFSSSSTYSKGNGISAKKTSFKPTNFSKLFADDSVEDDRTIETQEISSKYSSTLSLHIAAYENDDSAENGDWAEKVELVVKQKSTLLNGIKQRFTEDDVGPFEFPRQEQDDEVEPETTKFKASQKLLDSNQKKSGSKKLEQDSECDDIEKDGKEESSNYVVFRKPSTRLQPPASPEKKGNGYEVIDITPTEFEPIFEGLKAVPPRRVFLGELSPKEAEKKVSNRSSFRIYYRLPSHTPDSYDDLPPQLSLYVIYRNSRGNCFHYPIAERKVSSFNGPTVNQIFVEYGEPAPNFSTLSQLVKYYETYTIINGGTLEIFPWWNSKKNAHSHCQCKQ